MTIINRATPSAPEISERAVDAAAQAGPDTPTHSGGDGPGARPPAAPGRGGDTSSLSAASLPRWAVPAVAAVAVLVAGVANAFTGVQGWFGTALVGAAVFLTGQSAWSFAVEGRRHAMDRLATTTVYATFVMALVPLASVLFTVLIKGMRVMSLDFLTHSMRNVSPRMPGGGAGHAIVGTLEQVALAAAVAVPIGVLAAVYLVEYGRGGSLARWVSFFVDVMTGIPSIVSGLFIFTAFVLALGLERSGFTAALSLGILMLPVVIRTTEEMLRIVPNELREAAYALGVPKWRTILRVVLPTALAGIVTGVMLAVARVAGETAPLLLTTFLSQSFNYNPFRGPQAALPTFVWDQITSGTPASVDRAWAGALTLIAMVMVFYITAKLLAARFAPRGNAR
ncbi:MAG: phosphate ABC transporter permease PstA [Candidatus Nanopelagicales bacterium]